MYIEKNLDNQVRGDTWILTFNIQTSAGAPENITNKEYWFTLKSLIDDTDANAALQIGPVVAGSPDASQGILTITITPDDTGLLEAKTYFYDLQEVDTSNQVTTLLIGKVKVVKDVTLIAPFTGGAVDNYARETVGDITKDMTGFPSLTDSDYSFNSGTRTFTIAPTGTSYSVYYRGKKTTITTSKSIVITNTPGGRYIKLNPTTFALEEGSIGAHPTILDDLLVAYIYWNGSAAIILGDERHSSSRDTNWHQAQHLNVGSVWRSGGDIAYTLNSNTISLGLSNVTLADEDLLHIVTHSATPTNHYEQIIASNAVIPVIYLSGTSYTQSTPSSDPWLPATAGGRAARNLIVGGSGSLSEIGNGKFVSYWLLGTNDSQYPIKLLMGNLEHANEKDALAETFVNYGLPFPEMVPMYKIVLQSQNGYVNNAKVQIISVNKIISRQSSSTTLVETLPLGALAGTGFTSTTTTGTAITAALGTNGLSMAIPAYLTAASGAGIVVGAGSQTATSGTIVFSNSNGITFGMSGSNQITASYTVPTQSVQTQASGAIAGTGFTSTTTAGTAVTAALGTNGLNMAIPAYLTTQSVQTQASGNIVGSGFTSTTTAGTAVTAALGSNGLNMAIPAYLTTQSVQTQASGAIAGTGFTSTTTAGTAVTAALGTNGLNMAIPAYLTTQSVQTQASGNIVGSGFTSTTTAGTAVTAALGSNGLNMAIPAYLTTQSVQTQASGNIARTGFSSTTTTGTAIVGTLDTNGLNLGVPAYLTAAAGGGVAIGASTQTATSGTVIFSNSNGISFGLNNGTLTASAAGAGNSSWTVSDSATSGTVGRLAFTNLNGVTLSLSTGAAGSHTIVGSHNGLTSQSNQAFSASGGSSAFQTLNFANTNGVTFSNSNGSVQVTHDLQYTSNTSAITASALNTSVSRVINVVAATNNAGAGTASISGNISFTNANGMTFYTSAGSAIAASYSVPVVPTAYVSSVNGSSGAISLNVGSSLSASTNGSSITFGLATDITTRLQSAGAYLTTAAQSSLSNLSIAVAATNNTGGGTATLATSISFTNANGMTFYTSAGNAIAASYTVPTQSVQTQASGNIVGSGFTSTTTVGTAIVGTQNSLGLSLGVPVYLTTQSVQTQASGNLAGIGFTSTTTAGTAVVGTLSTNGLSLGVPVYLTTQSVQTQASGAIAGTGFTSTTTTGTAITAALGTNGLNMAIPAYLTAAGGGNFSGGISNLGNTAGNTGITGTRIVFVGTNNISLSQATDANGATISINQTGGGGGPTAYVASLNGSTGSISLNVGSSLSSSVNGSSITFGLANNITTALQSAGNYLTTARASNDAIGLNTAATNVTWTVSSNGLSLNAAGYAGTNTSANNASLTLNSNGLTISVAAPGAANYSIGVSNLGNTAGNTGITGTRIVFVGTNNISLSQATDANGATISFDQTGGGVGGAMYANLSGNVSGNTTASGNTLNFSGINVTLSGTNNSQIAISAPATSSIVGANGISISSNGSTISVLNQFISSYENVPFVGVTTMALNMASVSQAAVFNVPEPLSISYLRIPISISMNSTTIASSAASATGGAAIYSTFNAVVYSMGTGGNSQSLQSVASGSGGFTFSNSISIATNGTQYSISQGYSAQALGGGTTFTTQTSSSLSTYAFSTNSFSNFSAARFLDIPFTASLQGGPYWIVFGGSTSSAATTGVAGLSAMTNCNARYTNHYGVSGTNVAFGVMGSTNLTSGGQFGAGSFSTVGGGTTNSINLSQISTSAAHNRLYFQMLRFA